jgi:hypothetical protein
VYSMVTTSPCWGEGPLPSTRMVFWTPMLRGDVVKNLVVVEVMGVRR